jgi:phosphoribosylformimino-5-aminoimidazole carboxamide ribotide isomerase
LHGGRVKQIVGGTLSDDGAAGSLVTNFETEASPAYFAGLYRGEGLRGGHVIMLGPGNVDAALGALGAWPGGMHVGGGINPGNAGTFLDAGASHVIVTSYVFCGGEIMWERLKELAAAVSRERLVLDLSCRLVDGEYVVATDRWQKLTRQRLSAPLFERLAGYCDEFLVHAADVEGLRGGVDADLISLLAAASPIQATYAGGVRNLDDMDLIDRLGGGRVDATVGSSLDIFGGTLAFADVVGWHRARNPGCEAQAGPPDAARNQFIPVRANAE